MTNDITLGAWLREELTQRGWTAETAAGAAKTSAAIIDRLAQDDYSALTPVLCLNLAAAFGVPVYEVYRRAGLPLTLGAWIQQEMDRRQPPLTQRDVAQMAGTSTTTIFKLVHEERNSLKPAICMGLARAFGVPVDEVYTRAGILPVRGEILPAVRDWSDRLADFSPEDQARLVMIFEQVLAAAEAMKQKDQAGPR